MIVASLAAYLIKCISNFVMPPPNLTSRKRNRNRVLADPLASAARGAARPGTQQLPGYTFKTNHVGVVVSYLRGRFIFIEVKI